MYIEQKSLLIKQDDLCAFWQITTYIALCLNSVRTEKIIYSRKRSLKSIVLLRFPSWGLTVIYNKIDFSFLTACLKLQNYILRGSVRDTTD